MGGELAVGGEALPPLLSILILTCPAPSLSQLPQSGFVSHWLSLLLGGARLEPGWEDLGGEGKPVSPGLLDPAASGEYLFQLSISLYQGAGICMGLKS